MFFVERIEMRGMNPQGTEETVVAAANAVAYMESRVQPGTVPKNRWKAWFGAHWCFGIHGQASRIRHASLVPEPVEEASLQASSSRSSGLVVAPPSSPSSFLQSEPPSTAQSPAKFFSLSTLGLEAYASPARPSIFTVGPYADDTKLVSPPVFSTEPSTAPLTPLQQTTPPSPEVPFARLMSAPFCKGDDLRPYQLQPGSPIGHLISPPSVSSGVPSPFPDMELHSPTDCTMLPSQITVRRLLDGGGRRAFGRDSDGSILDGWITAIQLSEAQGGGCRGDENEAFEFNFSCVDAGATTAEETGYK